MDSRRSFLKNAAVVGAAVASQRAEWLRASALGLPLGLQLYSVREQLPKDYLGTLKQIAALGYKEVEAAGFYDKTPAEVKAAMQQAGLSLVSAHYSSSVLFPQVDSIIEYAKALGLQWIVCSFPAIKNPARLKDQTYQNVRRSFELEDWRYNAEQFNQIGEKVKRAGMRFAYHNHTMEFQPTEGVVPFDELVRLTDPDKVWFEVDTGWVVVGGGDPEAVLKKDGKRVKMIHVKDFASTKPTPAGDAPKPTELGQGAVDIPKILAAAKRYARIEHCFVEQEGFDVPWVESLRIDAEYMEKA
jgi:sugar phosphate isomerase/epimerase